MRLDELIGQLEDMRKIAGGQAIVEADFNHGDLVIDFADQYAGIEEVTSNGVGVTIWLEKK